jgi:transcriptional regulator with XRE-family HTH domain
MSRVFPFFMIKFYISIKEEIMNTDLSILGKRIRSLREDNDMTQKELSSMVGLTPKMISFYENNQRMPPVDVLLKLSEIFDVTTDYLLGKQNKITSPFNDSINLDTETVDVVRYYKQLSITDKRWIVGQMIDLIKKNEVSEGFPKAVQ